MNYKEIDTQRIIDYIGTFANGVSVDDIILHSGADKLRVYPALFELEQSGWLEVLEREELGAPSMVRKKKVEEKKNDREQRLLCFRRQPGLLYKRSGSGCLGNNGL